MTLSSVAPRFAASFPVSGHTAKPNAGNPVAGQPAAEGPHFGASDPKPSLGKRNLTRLLVALAGSLVFYAGPGNAIHNTVTDTEQGIEAVAPSAHQAIANLNDGFVQLDQANQAARDNIWGVGGVEDLYMLTIQWEALAVALAAAKGMSKKGLRQKDIYAQQHQQGITGKGLTVGVVDSGYRHSLLHRNHDVTFYSPDNLDKPSRPVDRLGHGTAVTNIIADAVPDARFVVVSYTTKKQQAEVQSNLNKLLKAARKDPKSLTLKDIRKVFAPMIENIANGVRKSVDEGAQVVNVSLSIEQAVQMSLMMSTVTTLISLASLKLFSGSAKRETPEYKKDLQNHKDMMSRLIALKDANEETELINDDIKELYKPWLDALDYAADHGAAVHLASGNSGGHKNKKKNTVGNINLLAAIQHPALFVVGSTTETGEVSKFSSEFNDEIQPDYAMNGSGEISTRIASPNRGLLSRLLSPLAGLNSVTQKLQELTMRLDDDFASGVKSMLNYSNPKGTSFAAPDSLSLHAMSIAVRMKTANPNLSLEEIRDILVETATQTHFDPKELKKIEKEVTERLSHVQRGTAELMDPFREAVAKLVAGKQKTASLMDGKIQLQRTGQTIQLTMDTPSGKPASMKFKLEEVDTDAERRQRAEMVAMVYLTLHSPKLKSAQAKDDFSGLIEELQDGKPTPEQIQAEVGAELKRRVGAGTLAGHRQEVLEKVVDRGNGNALAPKQFYV